MQDAYDGWWFLALFMVILPAVAVAALLARVIRPTQPIRTPMIDRDSEALEILRRRYASGEIDGDEFQRRAGILGQRRP